MTWYIDENDKMKFNQVTEDSDIIRGYKSPIEIIATQWRTECENGTLRVVREYFPSIDKDELIKALEYDRDQYDKGYADGVKDMADKLKKWVIESSNYWFSTSVNAEIDEVLKEMIGE